MNDTSKGPRDGKDKMRRVRNLPLILILTALAAIVLVQAGDLQSGKTAVITYTPLRTRSRSRGSSTRPP